MDKDFLSCIKRTVDKKTGIIEYSFTALNMQTADDVRDFFKCFVANLVELPPPRDVIVCLDNVTVGPDARDVYGEVRSTIGRTYYRHSARYAGIRATKLATMVSALRYKTEGMVYATRDEAIAAILTARKNAY